MHHDKRERARNNRPALLLIDVINDLEFDGGDRLLPAALAMAEAIAALKTAARARGIPTIYVNDNFSHWQSSIEVLIDTYLARNVRGAPLVRMLRPDQDDYHVLKPHQSGFFGTPLELLLEHLEADRVLITGLTSDRCVMLTAMDAYMRGYGIAVPADCAAAIEPEHHDQSLAYMARVLQAETRPSTEDLEDWL